MIGAAITAGLGLVNAGFGAAQYIAGKRMEKKNVRPEYQIPDEIKANMSNADRMAMQGLPEEQKQQYITNLQRSQTFALNQMGSRKAGLAGLAAINQQGVDAYGGLLSSDSQARQQNQQLAMQQRQVMADYKDQQFQLNKLNPYYEKASQSQGLKGAGIQNIANGIQTATFGLGNMNFKKPTPTQNSPQSNINGQNVSGFNFNQRNNQIPFQEVEPGGGGLNSQKYGLY